MESFLKINKEGKGATPLTNRRRSKRVLQQEEENSNKAQEAQAHEGILRMLNLKSVTLKAADKTRGKKGKEPMLDEEAGKGRFICEDTQ